MAAYQSRGRGILTRVRIDHRVSLEELAGLLFMSSEETDDELSVATVRHAISETLRISGTDALTEAGDALRDAGADHEARLSWCRQQVACAYQRDFSNFPDTLAQFELANQRHETEPTR